jgi:hypothetical protein
VPHKDDQSRAEGHRLTAEEVGARVGAILGDAEREAREIIAAARRDGVDAQLPPTGATIDDLTAALENLSSRFDAFELATAAQVEDLGRQLREALAAGSAAAPAVEAPSPRAPAPPPREDSPAVAAARVRAIDLALAGYSRDVIANELATSLDRAEVEMLLADVLLN